MPYDTDERLKSYLDSNQPHREQLCLAILAMDRRFTNVRPRHPRGGPDGGRDIEANFQGDQRAYCAVGFINQADDSPDKKRRITGKFNADLSRIICAIPKPDVFVFLTNMNLTIGEKEELEEKARAEGIAYCEIFDRERLRIALDSPDGLAARFQYLRLSLSEEEQASFFAKWGDDIVSLVTTGFQEVKSTLDRLLFLQEASAPLGALYVVFELDRTYSADEIFHFRAFCHLFLKGPKHNILSILFGTTDKSDRLNSNISPEKRGMRPGIGAGISGGQWEQPLDPSGDEFSEVGGEENFRCISTLSAIGRKEVQSISINYSKNSPIRFEPVFSLRDFNEAMFILIINESLANKLKNIHIYANEYKLFKIDNNDFYIDNTEFDPNVPIEFTPEELTDQWVRIRPNDASAFNLNFSEGTPKRIFIPKPISDISAKA